MRVDMSRFRVVPGKAERVDAWLQMINDRMPETLATLEREAMKFEAIFRERIGADDYLTWVSVQDEKGADVGTSPHEVDRLHLAFWSECTLLIFAIGMLLFSQANHGITLLLAGAIIGLGYGNFLSCGQAISIKGAPPDRLGLATATYYIFLDLGFGIGPYLFGSLVPFTGYRGLYLMMVAVILATIILYYFLYRRKAVSTFVAH